MRRGPVTSPPDEAAGGGLGLPPSLKAGVGGEDGYDLSGLPPGAPDLDPEAFESGRLTVPGRGSFGKSVVASAGGSSRTPLILGGVALALALGLGAVWFLIHDDEAARKNAEISAMNAAAGGIFKPISPAGDEDTDFDIDPDALAGLTRYDTAAPAAPDASGAAPSTDATSAPVPVSPDAGAGSTADGAPDPADAPAAGDAGPPDSEPETPASNAEAVPGVAVSASALASGVPVSAPLLSASARIDIVVPPRALEPGEKPGRMPRFADLPAPLRPQALAPAPVPDLVEDTEKGPLPVIGPDGRTPWEAYRRPFENPRNQPRVAIILTGLGINAEATRAAVSLMPPEVSLAFSPYGTGVGEWMKRARAAGHETLLEMAVETGTVDGERVDPGPLALRTRLSGDENLTRLRSQMMAGVGYTGFVPAYAGAFTDSPGALRPVLAELKARGLLYIQRGNVDAVNANSDVTPALNQVMAVLDEPSYQKAVAARLEALEEEALMNGYAIGIMKATPLTLSCLFEWNDRLNARGVLLAPVSALVSGPAVPLPAPAPSEGDK